MSEYAYRDGAPTYPHRYLLPVIERLVRDVPAGATVVDLGSGNGALLRHFEDRGWSRFGVESSASGLSQARAADPAAAYDQADVSGDLSAHPAWGRADLVLSTEVVEHLYAPRAFARNCAGLLRPTGRLVLSTPYHGYLKNLALAVTGKLDDHFTALWDHGHIKFWSRRTLSALLAEAGLEVTGFHGVGRAPLLWKSMVVVARPVEVASGTSRPGEPAEDLR